MIRAIALQGDRAMWSLDWAGLQAVGRVESIRIIGDQTSKECRILLMLFLGSRSVCGRRAHALGHRKSTALGLGLGRAIWRRGLSGAPRSLAENLALIRRVALNMRRHNGPPRDNIRCRKLRAALNDDDRLRLLLGQSGPATA